MNVMFFLLNMRAELIDKKILNGMNSSTCTRAFPTYTERILEEKNDYIYP